VIVTVFSSWLTEICLHIIERGGKTDRRGPEDHRIRLRLDQHVAAVIERLGISPTRLQQAIAATFGNAP
jgi:hypothetical protein